jgi:hypothetical protein
MFGHAAPGRTRTYRTKSLAHLEDLEPDPLEAPITWRAREDSNL